MGDETCPQCDKTVMGRSALLAHLEFSHGVDDPAAYLAELFAPPKRQRRWHRSSQAPEAAAPEVAPPAPTPSAFSDLEPVPAPALASVPDAEPAPTEVPATVVAPRLPPVPAPDPVAPRPERRRTPRPEDVDEVSGARRWVLWGAIAAANVVLVAGVFLLTGGDGDGAADGPADGVVAASAQEPTDDPEDGPAAPDADDPADGTPTSVPSTTTDGGDGSVPAQAATGGISAGDFRAPFVVDAGVESCTSTGSEDVYALSITFSGARDIVFDGTPHPGRGGDGEHTVTHRQATGSKSYFDHVEVADAAGTVFRIDLTPPVYLGGCG